MNLQDYVTQNQKIIDLVKDRTGGDSQVDMYYGTLDYAFCTALEQNAFL